MHGLINRSVQNFVCDTFGKDVWLQVTQRADLGFSEFEAMLSYKDDITPRLLDSMAAVTHRSLTDLLEDIGTYLVSTPKLEGVRRLLRFGGVNFEEFLQSLDDLPDRAKLAVSDLDLPRMELDEKPDGQFDLICQSPVPGFGLVMTGVLRVIADDYGALVVLDHETTADGFERVSITLIDTDFAEGRQFELGAPII
ncbi:heme NO-binding domain-containing protein [Roseobacter sp. GAI101]|uniref:heme NO-binding domain-containing protein n=1 Tax=Roseobacter sp. (strain GAI101) TaxID=391589 RepID=UPI00018720DF|nr:heme NO-binding domain-containing protein [Roseobacter sp. GAI101]EEB84909.1 heme NO binding domain protein [Roseobacter sp. GAI101]